jgi:hypothetical protein
MSLGIHSEVDEQRSEVGLLWEIALGFSLGFFGPIVSPQNRLN